MIKSNRMKDNEKEIDDHTIGKIDFLGLQRNTL